MKKIRRKVILKLITEGCAALLMIAGAALLMSYGILSLMRGGNVLLALGCLVFPLASLIYNVIMYFRYSDLVRGLGEMTKAFFMRERAERRKIDNVFDDKQQ